MPRGYLPDPNARCGFGYDDAFPRLAADLAAAAVDPGAGASAGLFRPRLPAVEGKRRGLITYRDPEPPTYARITTRWGGRKSRGKRTGRTRAQERAPVTLILPGYRDTMQLFGRAGPWLGDRRCYETPAGARLLTTAQAYEVYRDIAELTTGVRLDPTFGVRSVVGIRGAYPGRFTFHGNQPDRFNDTLALLWIDESGPHVREFPANTDTGVHNFGPGGSAALRPNRRYRYRNGTHRGYHALRIAESDYVVVDDANHNGHWDCPRDGFLGKGPFNDHDRIGRGHNIHMGAVGGALGQARVGYWSAGCQVIPGMANWIEFITNAWTYEGDPVNYFFVDVRDIDPRVWRPCQEDGSHGCPFVIPELPYTHFGDTAIHGLRHADTYTCTDADVSGPEVVYLLTLDRSGTLRVRVDDVPGDGVDVDVMLLEADDGRTCLAAGDTGITRPVGPGRYYIIVETYVDGPREMAGPYRLDVTLD
jgi:hypothetical protein